MKTCKNLLNCLLLIGAMMFASDTFAQKVIFPQQEQPGIAEVSETGGVYTLSNGLFSASFIKEEGKLMFHGCEELGLLPGTEIFEVKLADGTVIPASEFTLGEVTTENLAAKPDAVKGSHRFAGVQIKAEFTHSNGLAIEWHAVLRDGSHYLRTEAIITTGNDIEMYSIKPMIYTVQNKVGEKAPAVIGNTRGAVVASDRIFAGLETPTAFNTAGGDNDLSSFVFDAWDGASSWAWTPEAEEIPQGIRNLSQYAEGTVNGSRGYLVFRKAGDQVITFDYTSGNNRLQILGVDLLDLSGNIIDSDYHFGYSGGSDSNRDYTVTIPSADAYMLRYFVTSTGSGEGYSSVGTITYSISAKQPELVYDLASTEKPYVTPAVSETTDDEEAEENLITDGSNISLTWTAGLPNFSLEENAPENLDTWNDTEATILVYSRKMQYTIDKGTLTVKFQYTSGNNTLDVVGVDILDADGKVVASDYHYGTAGTSSFTVVVPEKAEYTLRFLVDSQGKVPYNSNGNITMTFVGDNGEELAPGTTINNSWVAADWVATEAANVPQDVIDLGCTTANARLIEKRLNITAPGTMNVTLTYTNGNHKLNIMGVDLVDDDGNVVAGDYHVGTTGNSHSKNTYTFDVENSGVYTLRYIANNAEVINSTGNIVISYTGDSTSDTGTALVINEDDTIADSWTPERWADIDDSKVPARIVEAGCLAADARIIEQTITINAAGTLSIEFVYSSGSERLDIVGVDLLDENGNTVVNHYQAGYAGNPSSNNTYKMNVTPGTYTLRYFANNAVTINSSGTINISLKVDYTVHLIAMSTTPIEGLWLRNTTLTADENWKVSSVVGVVAPGQLRRSFLAYSERERAVPWRTFPHYNSWYELNINRNNAADPTNNMTADQVLDVLAQWKTNYYDKYGEGIVAFVIDDGWDNYGPWTFHDGFPNEMRDMAVKAKEMGAGVGAWLGPVGGYGTSGNYRRNYWNAENRGGMLLSNPAYYTVFKAAAENLVCNQDGTEGFDRNSDNYMFFKFDGISDLFSATGPKASATGNEDAEGIIRLERYVREELREDIFFNTTVGTWASPFWYQISDATWRQENDHDHTGNNSINRENWITYRDRLVYQNYVQNSPICPINTLMTHGFILTNYGPPASDSKDYNAVLRELRCAFACGSGIVELYADYSLLNSIQDNEGNAGALWGDIADCVEWQKKNADVLPDIHWVGGNPWSGSKAEIYGWASWNGEKATFTLRNGGNDAQSIKLTLREALDIPEYIETTITLGHAFADQADIAGFSGITVGTPIDIDTELTITLPGSSVFVFDGSDNSVATVECGKYYRFKDSQNNYLAAGSTLSSKNEADASTIFYLTEESKLLSYSTGNYLNKAGGIETAGHPGNVAHFKNGTADGTVMIGVSNGTYLSSADGTIATAGSDWIIEEVTTLPVKVSSVKYATFYAPIDVSLPSEGDFKAYAISEANEGRAQLEEITDAIPANTGVIINAAEGTYDLAITSGIAEYSETNLLSGTVASTMIEKGDEEYYILSNHSTEGVGMYRPVYAEDETRFLNQGHKAYMHLADSKELSTSYSFIFGDGTTGVVKVEIKNEKEEIYDLTGRKVETPTKGIYIVNGEKVFIK